MEEKLWAMLLVGNEIFYSQKTKDNLASKKNEPLGNGFCPQPPPTLQYDTQENIQAIMIFFVKY